MIFVTRLHDGVIVDVNRACEQISGYE
jgi:PAS domain-containing protein